MVIFFLPNALSYFSEFTFIEKQDITKFLHLFPECNQDDIDCMQYLYPIWKSYKKMLISARIPRQYTLSRLDGDSESGVFSMNSKNVPPFLSLETAKYKKIAEFTRRLGNNCGGGIYSQLSALDSFPKLLVFKSCARVSEIQNMLVMISEFLFATFIQRFLTD